MSPGVRTCRERERAQHQGRERERERESTKLTLNGAINRGKLKDSGGLICPPECVLAASVLWWAAAVDIATGLPGLIDIVLPIFTGRVRPRRRLLSNHSSGTVFMSQSEGCNTSGEHVPNISEILHSPTYI